MRPYVCRTVFFLWKKAGVCLGSVWNIEYVPVAQWLEHCVSNAKGCGFNSQGTHILTKNNV